MQTPLARQCLEKMLQGNELDEGDLRALVAADGETLYIDFKDGAETNDTKKAARTVRQYVSGFANADGGLLVVGVSDGGGKGGSRRFTPTTRPGGRPLGEWARTVLESLAGHLTPPPRLQVVIVDNCEVLVIAAARAPALVSCVEEGQLRYYLRIGDSTPSIPPYLISDLVLGRREHPALEVRVPPTLRPAINGAGNVGSCLVNFAFDVENTGMVPAADVIVGVISYARLPRDRKHGRIAPAYLRNFVDAHPALPVAGDGESLLLVHVTSRRPRERLDLAAFEDGRALGIGDLLVPREAGHGGVKVIRLAG